jgi:hypothetical protein
MNEKVVFHFFLLYFEFDFNQSIPDTTACSIFCRLIITIIKEKNENKNVFIIIMIKKIAFYFFRFVIS